jgi:hypothetical protein
MKYLFALLFFLPFTSFAQKTCSDAYIHIFNVLDSLPVPASVQIKLDSAQKATEIDLARKKKSYVKKYKSPKVVATKLKEDQATARTNNLKLRRYLEQRFYVKQISAAQLQIYDKGKVYKSVFNADSPLYPKIPENTCDETKECLRLVREALEKSGER